MQNTPNSNRLHIAIFGKRNAGKSSLINAITDQNIALVSTIAGTTTDPVYKAMELLPIGPVVIIDTAGIDDVGMIGKLRIKKTKEVIAKTDLALLVFDAQSTSFDIELEWYSHLKQNNIPIIGVINKIDASVFDLETFKSKFDIPFVETSALKNINIDQLKHSIQLNAPKDYEKSAIVGDILKTDDLVILVAPQDIQAPKGRLILPQVQTIRDLLDHKAMALTVTDLQLEPLLKSLNKKPDLVITDSQIFKKVNQILSPDIPLTSFSILMARYKGDLDLLIQGAQKIGKLKSNDKILIAESCTHHTLDGDIGREKIPNWLRNYTQLDLDITVKAGVDFSQDLSEYSLIIHCGGCMLNQKQMYSRLVLASNANIPITNYGMAIAFMEGILTRVTNMF